MKKLLAIIVTALFFVMGFAGCKNASMPEAKGNQPKAKTEAQAPSQPATTLREDGTYTNKAQVAAYIHKFHKLPRNYITKNEAHKMGWPKEGTLNKVAPGRSIGGDRFGNHEGKLPKTGGVHYTECDIDYVKGNRGPKRIVFDNKGNIYYCGDHYNTFEKLY